MIDYHIHTSFSCDSETPMISMAEAAHKRGLTEICFTDHIDLDFPGGIDFVFDFDKYDMVVNETKKAFPDMNIRKGVEAGLDPGTKQELQRLISGSNFDYVIGSVHLVCGLDPYKSEFWDAYTKCQAFEEYLKVCIECATEIDFFDVFGHIGYVSKFCPLEEPLFKYSDYKDAVDELLKILIEKGKGIEVNTSGIKNTGSVMPETPIIKRYFELGGEIITVGSDAHEESAVGRAVNETLGILKSVGYKYVCAFDNRKPKFICIP